MLRNREFRISLNISKATINEILKTTIVLIHTNEASTVASLGNSCKGRVGHFSCFDQNTVA